MHTEIPAEKQLIAWLNDAYAMEQSQTKVLQNHAEDAPPDMPELRQKDLQHLYETRRHVEKIARCLDLLGEKPSKTKGLLGSVMGKAQGAVTGAFGDEIMKNCLQDYAMEHFEIACYRSLIVAAEELGRREIVEICEGILKEEESMARWLSERIPEVARLSLELAPVA